MRVSAIGDYPAIDAYIQKHLDKFTKDERVELFNAGIIDEVEAQA